MTASSTSTSSSSNTPLLSQSKDINNNNTIPFISTPISSIGTIISQIRTNWTQSRALYHPQFRLQQLKSLARMLQEQKQVILNALYQDLHKSSGQAYLTEIAIIHNEIGEAVHNLNKWIQPEYQSRQVSTITDSVYFRKEPLGVILIIGPWNYPLQLILVPLIAAIAAGNACIMKPSEVSPNTSQLLAEIIPQYLDQRFFHVINGGVDETIHLLNNYKFDHIIYTGNSTVARIVMTAAAKYLTPVTLELGGKSPVIIHASADLRNAARRIAFGKFMNAGQTCVAPDYVLIPRELQDKFIHELELAIIEYYGTNPNQSDDYGRIINDKHYDRLSNYISSLNQPIPSSSDLDALQQYGGKIVIGGLPEQTWDRSTRYIPPTVIANVGRNALLMDEEIFGPLLPIVPIDTNDESIQLYAHNETLNNNNNNNMDAFLCEVATFISQRDHPLAMYIFARDNSAIEWILSHTQSGGVTINDTIMHLTTPKLPFGGIGNSGMGAYHGKFGFDTLSHKRAVLHRPVGLEFMNSIRYSPITSNKINFIQRFAMAKI